MKLSCKSRLRSFCLTLQLLLLPRAPPRLPLKPSDLGVAELGQRFKVELGEKAPRLAASEERMRNCCLKAQATFGVLRQEASEEREGVCVCSALSTRAPMAAR